MIDLEQNDALLGKTYLDASFHILNVQDIINDNESLSSTCFVAFFFFWLGKYGHVNFSYLRKRE